MDGGELSEGRFESDVQRLHNRLLSWLNEPREVGQESAEGGRERPFTGPMLLHLGELFYDWAHFRPKDQPLAVLEVNLQSVHGTQAKVVPLDPKAEQEAVRFSTSNATEAVSNKPGSAASAPVTADESPGAESSAADEDEQDAESRQVDILNSFYLRDLERVRQVLRAGEDLPIITAYLQGRPRCDRVDLYQAGLDPIQEALQPSHLTRGRWLNAPTNRMSLMQQFAINQSMRLLQDKGLFSVNGPPGTGKTALLRDLIADILVQRASALAECGRATDAFLPDGIRVTFPGETRESLLAVLRAAIGGHEMVVASTNNAAVQNISEDLPKQKSIDSVFASVEYLQPVAHKVAAEKENGSYTVLEPGETPWGLVAGVLGRKQNRLKFRQRLSFKPCSKNPPEPAKGSEPKFQTIYDWIDRYDGPTFQEAKEAFRANLLEVTGRVERLQRLTELSSEFAGYPNETSFLANETKRVQDAEAAFQKSQQEIQLCKAELDGLQRSLAQAREEERLIDRAGPPLLLRWLPVRQVREYQIRKRENAEEQLRLSRSYKEKQRVLEKRLQPEERTCAQNLSVAQNELAKKRLCLRDSQEQIRALQAEFPEATGLKSVKDLESDQVQIEGLWHDDTLNRLRSDLFARALDLHQSWLAEVGRKGAGFRPNIFGATKLLEGKLPDKPDAVSLLWQSLFMIVPVVSTTFASVSRQFRGLGGGTLGWLFIDEAGQAVPQSAVGALWRARRAVVVGDPLQIEPVFTVPAGLIERLASLRPETGSVCLWPHKSSVQKLADLANQYGATVSINEEQEEWIGSPLRVHRRCVDPMFSIANEIAYRGKMVFGLADRNCKAAHDFGESAWIDLPGKATDGQMVPEQVQFCAELIERAYVEQGQLPEYYIITPFKKIRSALKARLEDAKRWDSLRGAQLPASFQKELRAWCKDRIGTVHTFQGKEAPVVIFVLGADQQSKGSADWVAKKPNLLNVAVTRAKRRLYIVGDYSLYQKLPYF
jgi:hypothetical protein